MIISYEPTANDNQPFEMVYGSEQELAIYLEGYVLCTTTDDSYWVRIKED